MSAPADGTTPAGELNRTLVQEIVRVHRRRTDRGPTKARAFFRDNVVVLVLQDVLTKGERTLIANGQEEAVLRIRDELYRSMRPELTGVVERVTERTVLALLAASDVGPDIASHVFLLDRPVGHATRPPARVRLAMPARRAGEAAVDGA